MITANEKMHIEIIVENNYTSYKRNGEIVFKVKDEDPYQNGYFGFRTVNNHMIIENFKVNQLK